MPSAANNTAPGGHQSGHGAQNHLSHASFGGDNNSKGKSHHNGASPGGLVERPSSGESADVFDDDLQSSSDCHSGESEEGISNGGGELMMSQGSI